MRHTFNFKNKKLSGGVEDDKNNVMRWIETGRLWYL